MVTAQELLTNDFIAADVNDTVSSLIGKMGRKRQSYAVVFDRDAYKGVASKKWLLSSRIDPAKMKVKNLITHRSKAKTQFFVPTLEMGTGLRDICKLLCTADTRALPVVVRQGKKEIVAGVVRAVDVLNAVRQAYKGVRASTLGTMELVTIKENEGMGKAIHQMHWEGVDRLVVVNGAGKFVGVAALVDLITDKHVLPQRRMRIPNAAQHQGTRKTGYDVGEKHKLLRLPVQNMLTRAANCSTAPPNAPVADIIDEMTAENTTSVVLVEKDKPVGIITVKDILGDYAKK